MFSIQTQVIQTKKFILFRTLKKIEKKSILKQMLNYKISFVINKEALLKNIIALLLMFFICIIPNYIMDSNIFLNVYYNDWYEYEW